MLCQGRTSLANQIKNREIEENLHCGRQQGGSLLFIQSVAGGGDLAATGPVHGGTEQGQLGMFCQGSESWHKELKEKKRAPTKKGCDELERISFEYNNVYRICPY